MSDTVRRFFVVMAAILVAWAACTTCTSMMAAGERRSPSVISVHVPHKVS